MRPATTWPLKTDILMENLTSDNYFTNKVIVTHHTCFQSHILTSGPGPCLWPCLVAKKLGSSSTPALVPILYCRSAGSGHNSTFLDAHQHQVAKATSAKNDVRVDSLFNRCPAMHCLLWFLSSLALVLCGIVPGFTPD